ncbi:4Fe-4S dicluster domain-containing protein [Niallia endozanthoxylica]|uniref:4Fe-4S dicluster domain-containing protein n=1 Tax=Niallia endozanthoxylica TaxID=2036016 RepID=A0A5J5HQ16_9BACI|nr:4Fe-4S dicluster domain-containing protein [Niallia endozanthoxylica]KAA9022900.1 4Fe-4S dicluster domain-containing protein [Niallia endozanthoxylica]
MALFSKWVESLDYEYEILSSCTHHKSHHSNCTKCVDACDKQAISITNGKPVIDHSECVQCGECMAACPVQAVAGILPKREIKQNGLMISGCHFPTITELLILHKKGVHSIIFENASFLEKWMHRMEQVNQMLLELGESPFSISTGSMEGEETCSRRELFSLWKKESKSLMKQMTPAKWRFNHHALHLRQYYPDFQFINLTVDLDKCTLCKVCERICDQKCFDIQKGHFALSMQGCNSCGLCADICPEKAIRIEEQIIRTEEIHYPVYEKTCPACNHSFNTVREHDETCTVCTKMNHFSQKGERIG